MPVSKKPRSKAALRTSTKTGTAAAVPDRRAMESFLAALSGHRGDDATAKAQGFPSGSPIPLPPPPPLRSPLRRKIDDLGRHRRPLARDPLALGIALFDPGSFQRARLPICSHCC